MDSPSGLLKSQTSERLQRSSPSWIDEFVKLTSHISSPEIFRKWSAYAAVAVATGRKVWLISEGKQVRTNIYAFLVGPPGIGKTAAIGPARRMLLSIPEVHVAPNAITKEMFIELFKATTRIDLRSETEVFAHSTFGVLSTEVVVFLRPGDTEFLDNIMDLYDTDDEKWEYATRMHGVESVANPHLTILGGITPKSMNDAFSNIFGRGFISRILLIFSSDRPYQEPFSVVEEPGLKHLSSDLKQISDLQGAFNMSMEALSFIRAWHKTGMLPVSTDPRFEEYNQRRFIHWMKLAMLRSAARTNELLITREDCEVSKADLLEVEESMPQAVSNMGRNPVMEIVNTTLRWMKIQLAMPLRRGRPISEMELRVHLMRDVPPQYLEATINTMVTSGLVLAVGQSPNRTFTPSV